MATSSSLFSEATAFNKLSKGKRKKKGSKRKEDTSTSKNKSINKLHKESSSTKLASSKLLVSCVQEPVWDTEYSEELSVPVPDLYPELSDSLPNMQGSGTVQGEMAKVNELHCDSEDNVQCVPASCGVSDLASDNDHNPHPGTSQSQEDSQLSNSHSQTKQKRKLAKPRKVRKRKLTDQGQDTNTSKVDSEHLDHSQITGKQGTWAQCSIAGCGKWRFLQNNVDPNQIPERWVCAMNENDKYNECSASQETFDSQDGNLNVMYTPYPSGAIVWAKMVGYPWWPAMMEDDPDYGYYCETAEDDVTPAMYHVVFFDKEVSRTWVNAACIRNFSCDDDPEEMGKVTFKGKNYRKQLTAATLAARSAVELPLQRRLAEYGFAARYKGPIGRKAVEEKKRSVSLETEELYSDSVTESSSQDICSSGDSYSSRNDFSSPEEIKRVKSKTPSKSKTDKVKPAKKRIKSKTKTVQQTKETDSSNKKKEAGKKKEKKAKKPTAQVSVITAHAPENSDIVSADAEMQPTDMNETVHGQCIEENQNKNEDTQLLIKQHHPSFPSSTKADSKETIRKNNKKLNNFSAKTPSDTKTQFKLKRKISDEAQGGNKRKISKDANSEHNCAENPAKSKEQKKADVKTKKKRGASEESKQKAGKVDLNHHNAAVGEDEGNTSALSSMSELADPEEKQGKTIGKAEESVSHDKPIRDEISLDSGVEGVSKENDTGCLKNQTNKVLKKKRASIGESKNSNEDASTSEKRVPGDGVHSKIHLKHQKPDFTLKRSPASTDVRVTLSQNSSRKKSLPKLVKAFKPPIPKVDKGPKMPKLLKPKFVSPALTKTEAKHDDHKEEEGKEVAKSSTVKKSLGTMQVSKLKRKVSQKKDQGLGETSKETKEEHDQANDILPEDLQAEIEEIDNDIASMQKELRVSDTSDTSISEERVISPNTDHQFLSHSPEF